MSTEISQPGTGGALWHPFADMGFVERAPFVIDRAEDVFVWDEDGRRYLDATASLWYANLGYGRDTIVDAVAAQLRRLPAYSIFGDYSNRPAMELADRLAALAPETGSRVFLGSGGGDAIDTAAKIARAHFQHAGTPDRHHLITRRHGYHGTHGFGTSLAGIQPNREGWGPLDPDVTAVAHDSVAALEAEIERVGADRVAAFFCEPVIGAGGVRLPPEGYIEGVAEVCARHGVLFVADCVIAGFGRLGTWLGIDRWPVKPDLITLAKGVSAGYLPLGAVIVAPRVAERFFPGSAGAPVLRHGATYAGHPAACAAGLAALDIYESESLIPRGRELEGVLADALAPLEADPLIGEVRAGLGLLAGIDLAAPVLERAPAAVARWQLHCREAGVLVRPLAQGIAMSPPLTITAEQLGELSAGLQQGLAGLRAELPSELLDRV